MKYKELLRKMINALSQGGVENAGFEARELLQSFSQSLSQSPLSDPEETVPPTVEKAARELLRRRLSGEPLQYILGEWEFYGFPFKVGKGVLIPRPDTEILVETARGFIKNAGLSCAKVLDLCAGSGCVGISLAKTCGARVVLVEKSREAFDYLRQNIALNNAEGCCKAVLGDCFDEYGEFDLIVSNPPYLSKSDMDNLQREVAFEPQTALYGGTDGLDFYRKLLKIHAKNVAENGLFAVETGICQSRAVMNIFCENGFSPSRVKDLGGIFRVVSAIKT